MNVLRVLAAFAVLLFLGPAPFRADEGRAVGQACDRPATVILQRSLSGIQDARFLVIETQADWCAFWDEAHSILSPRPPCDPALVDFTREIVIAASLGSRPTLCYGLSIDCIQALGASGNVRVHLTETVPSPGCNCLPAVAQPVFAVKLQRPVHQVQVRTSVVSFECP